MRNISFKNIAPVALTVILIAISSCANYQIKDDVYIEDSPVPGMESQSDCDPDTVYFQNTILPLVVSSCASTGCHDKGSHRDGIILTDYSSILRTGEIMPGNPGESEFMESLTDDDDDLMPPPPLDPLSAEQIQKLEKWILQGAKNNECTEGCDTSNASFAQVIWPMMEQYCIGCHNAGFPGGGIVIGGFDDLVALAVNGSLMGSVRWESAYANMPTSKALSDCDIALLQKWIDDGFSQ